MKENKLPMLPDLLTATLAGCRLFISKYHEAYHADAYMAGIEARLSLLSFLEKEYKHSGRLTIVQRENILAEIAGTVAQLNSLKK